MSEAPYPIQTFDYTDPAQLAAMYAWAGTDSKLANACLSAGRQVSAAAIGTWRRRYKLTINDPAYQRRAERASARTGQAPPPESAPQDDGKAKALEQIQEWLENRTVPAAPPPTAARNPGDYATCLVCSDVHFPHQHDGALEVFLGLADTIKPDEIVINGDLFDFSQIGRYVKDPAHFTPLQTDIDQCRELLGRFEAASPRSVRRFIVGNHEEGRWKNYLFTRAPELASLRCLTMEAVLGLTEMGWVWQPWEYWVTDQLIIYHGDRHTSALGGGSAMSARKESIDMGCSTVTGHTHHAGAFFRQDRAGYRVSYEIGGLMDARRMQEAGVTTHRTPTKAHDWHLACALIRYRPGHSAFRVELIPIVDDGGRTFCIWQESEIVA